MIKQTHTSIGDENYGSPGGHFYYLLLVIIYLLLVITYLLLVNTYLL